MGQERISRPIQFAIFLAVAATFAVLTAKSWNLSHADTNVGYTKAERQTMERVTQKALREAKRAEQNQGQLVALFGGEPDGTPIETFRNGSAER